MLRLAFRYGVWMSLGFTGLFLLMHLLGLSDNFTLRLLNGFIHLGVLWYALRAWLHEHPDHSDNYTEGVALGMLTSGVGAGIFSIFLMIFLGWSPGLMASIQAQAPRVLAEYLNPVMAGTLVFGEGIIVGLIGSYILMRILEARYYRSV